MHSTRIAALVLGVLAAAVTVVELRHRSRLLFAELQALQAERDELNTEWGKLLLEEGAWAQHRRVEATARARLHMDAPGPERIVVIRAPAEPAP